MADKTFVANHRNARTPLTITGKTFEQACKKEGLNPVIWKEVKISRKREDVFIGNNQGNGREEDH